jgi:hypothetical protein
VLPSVGVCMCLDNDGSMTILIRVHAWTGRKEIPTYVQ